MSKTRRKPRRWDELDPWVALATAVTMQAHQDLVRGARLARVIIQHQGVDNSKKATLMFYRCKAVSAAAFFLHSPVWHYFASNMVDQLGDGSLPDRLADDVRVIRCALQVLSQQKQRQKEGCGG